MNPPAPSPDATSSAATLADAVDPDVVSPTLVFVEVADDGQPTRTSLEAATTARDVAERAGLRLVAVAVQGEGDAPAEGFAKTLGAYGVGRIVALDHPSLHGPFAPGRWGAALAEAIARLDAVAVIAPGTEHGTEVLAHAAAVLDLPMAANCTAIEPVGQATGHATGQAAGQATGHATGQATASVDERGALDHAATTDAPADGTATWRITRLRWGGVLLEDAELAAPRGLFTTAPHHIAATPAVQPVTASAEALPLHLDGQEPVQGATVVDHADAADGVTLATARVVVSGGRGVGSAEGFAPLEELAALLGGAVGCSRVATNAGWRSHNDQVGQTGTRVAPDLYIACGISGATQHWVGCMNSKRILAINTDPEAPMVTRAHDAVIADVHQVLGAVLEQVRARKGVQV